ncbi:MAG: YoaK family protein [Acidimicrobiales bacterium]
MTEPRPGAVIWKGLTADERHGSLPGILVVLTFVAGIVDALSILRLDHVFVANITGNIIFIGLALVGARGFSVAAPLIVFASFLAGAAAAGTVTPRPLTHRGRAAHAAVLVQLVDLAFATGMFAANDHPGTAMRNALLVVIALGMGAKSALVRAINVPGLTTSVFTTTLTALAADGVRGDWRTPGFAVRVIAALALGIGAVAGAVLALKTYAWCSCALATAVLLVSVPWANAVARSRAPWTAPAA